MLSSLFSKNNPEKLYEAYLKETDQAKKEQIISTLIELKADSLIEKIFLELPSLDLLEKIWILYKDSISKILDLFHKTTDEYKQIIFQHFIDIDAESILLKLIDTSFEKNIIDYLMQKYFGDSDRLLLVIDKLSDNGKKSVITSVLKLGDFGFLKKIFLSKHKEVFVNSLVEAFESNLVDQDDFLQAIGDDVKDEIIGHLINKKINSQESYQYDFIQTAMIKTSRSEINDFLMFWEPFLPIISINESLLVNFFYHLYDVQKLYLLLWLFGIEQYIEVPKLKCKLTILKNYFYIVNDCNYYKLYKLSELFPQVFSDAIDNMDKDRLVLASLLNRDIFDLAMPDAELVLEESYESNATKSANGQRIPQKNNEYSNFQKVIGQLMDVSSHKIPFYPQLIFSRLQVYDEPTKGLKIDLRAFSKDTKIVEDVEQEKKNLQLHLEKMTSQLSSPQALTKLKDIAKVKVANLVNLNDFLFSLNHLSLKGDKDYSKELDILCTTFQNTALSIVQRMVLKKIMELESFTGSKKLYNSKLDFDDDVLLYYFNYLNRQFVNEKNTLFFIKSLCKMPTLIDICTIKHLMPVNFIAFSHNSDFVASAGSEKTVQILELATNQIYKYYHNSVITQLYATPDGNAFYSESKEYLVKKFSLKSHVVEAEEKKDSPFETLAYSYNKGFVAERNENEFKIFNYLQGKTIVHFKHTSFINNIIISLNDKYVIAYTSFEVIIVHIDAPDKVNIIKSKRAINSVEISSNSRYLIVALGDRWKGEVKIIELNTSQEIWSKDFENSVTGARFSHDLERFSICQVVKDKSMITIHDSFSKEITATMNSNAIINNHFFWTNTNFVVLVRDTDVLIFDYVENVVFKRYSFDTQVNCCCISKEGSWLAISSENIVNIYHLLDIQKQAAYNLVQSLLSFQSEKDSEFLNYLVKNKSSLINESPIEHKKCIQFTLDYLTP